MSTYLPMLGLHFLYALPALLTAGAGAFFALDSRREHPPVSDLVLGAMAVMAFNALLGVGLGVLPLAWTREGHAVSQLGFLLGVIGLGRGLLNAVTVGMLLYAALGWRKAAA